MWQTQLMTTTTAGPTFRLQHRVQLAMETAGYSVQGFADELDVSRATVSRWLNGRGEPSKAQKMAIAMATNVPLEWLDGAEGGEARPERLELPTFCSVADLETELAFWGIVEPLEPSRA